MVASQNSNAVGALPTRWQRSDFFGWVAIQQGVGRGFVAAKLFACASLLGPGAMGAVGIALLLLSVVEPLTDVGIGPAIIQRAEQLDPLEAGAAFSLLALRGLALSIALFVLAQPLATLVGDAGSAPLVQVAALLPLLRNIQNLGLLMRSRERDFRSLACVDSLASGIDFGLSVTCAALGWGPVSILAGTIAAEVIRTTASWTVFRIAQPLNRQFSRITGLINYGKWIWGTQILVILLNNLDKVLVARLLGTTEFGLYQAASKIAQYAIFDPIYSLGNYWFATIARLNDSHRGMARAYVRRVLRYVCLACSVLAGLLIVAAPWLLSLLGHEWHAAVPVLRIFAVAMSIGAAIHVLGSYLRGVGQPRRVTQVVAFELLALLIAAPIGAYWLGAIGLALATTLSLMVACIGLLRAAALWKDSAKGTGG
ncbi:MAG: oligosaccharide flippase family protein [Burkholderiaceae bacterium]